MPNEKTEAPLRDVADLTDAELLEAADALGRLFGDGNAEDGPDGTEWHLRGYSTGSLREAIRQHLAEAQRNAALATAQTLSTTRMDFAAPDDELPF